MNCSEQNKERGFTLIEILVSMAIAMVVLAALSNTFVSQSRAYDAQEEVSAMQQNARAAMDLMVREIKMAGYDPAGNGFVRIQTLAADEFHFRADVDGDNDITGAGEVNEDLGYSHDPGNNRILRMDYIADAAPGVTLAENITALTFQYFDANGAVTAAPGSVRQVQVTLTARTSKIDPNTGNFQTYTVTSSVTPNNLAF